MDEVMSTNNINNKSKHSLRTIAQILLKIALFFIVIGVLIGVVASGAGAGYFASLVKDEPIADYDEMKNEIYNYEETSKIYFADNKYMGEDRKSTRLNSSHVAISYAVFCL